MYVPNMQSFYPKRLEKDIEKYLFFKMFNFRMKNNYKNLLCTCLN